MKHTLRAKALTWLLSFAMLALPVFASGSTVYADDSSELEPVTYMDWDEATGKLVEKTCTDYTVVDGLTIWQEGGMLDGRWYVVKGDVTFDASGPYDGRINIINSAKLILTDGCTLRANKGIKVCIDRSGDEVVNTLTIYGQKEGTGRLNAIATDSHAAIGGNGVRDDGTDFCDAGNVIINGGIIYAEGNVSAPGIGGGEHGKGGNVVINHGSLTAEGRAYSSGMIPAIGGGYKAEDEGTVSINKDLIAVAGNSKNDLTDVTDSFSQSHNQQYVYIGEPTNHTATFKVINGKWNDKTTGDKTYSCRTCNGVAVKIPAEGFPAAGNEPDMHYKRDGVWEPSQDTITAEDKTYTYYYSYEDDTPDIVIGADVLGDGRNTENAKTVMFGGKSWRVIGYKGHGVASERVNMTLLSSEILGHLHFGPEDNNSYADSELKTKIDEISGALTDGEKSAVPGRTLTSGTYTGYDTDCIAGAEVNDALMWPLSIKEANALNSTLRLAFHQDDTHWQRRTWWLRSPGSYSKDIAIVFNDGRVFEEGYPSQSQYFGVRPAFNVKLGAVLFSSAAGGKVSGAEGSDALKEVGKASGDTWKLTLKDNSRSGFTAQPKSVTDDTMTIKYAGAATGDNEYVSAIIADSESYIKYYGRIKKCSSSADASGTVTINTADKIGKDDTLYVFNEQFNGDNKTDYASVPIRCAMKYTWSEDNSSVTAMCTLPDGSETIETVNTTSKVTEAPFCEREGETTYTAEFTNPAFTKQTKGVKIPAYGHSWGTAKYSWNADNNSVTARRECSRDPRSHYESEVVSTTSEVTREPSCEEKGETTYTAAFHKEAFSTQTKVVETDALGHDWIVKEDTDENGWKVTKEATENSEGHAIRICSRNPDHIEEITIPPLEHKHIMEFFPANAATCETSGNRAYYECKGCNAWYEDEKGTTQMTGSDVFIPARGHKEGEPEAGPETKANCDSVGGYDLTTKCKNCGKVLKTERVVFPKDPDIHDWDEGIVTKDPTCSEKGVKTYTCKTNGSHTRTEDIDRLSHTPGAESTEDPTEPTCTSAGYQETVVRCTVCSEVLSSKRNPIPDKPALGHEWGDWVVTTPATETADGSETRTCSRCNDTQTRVIPRTGPSGGGDVEPTPEPEPEPEPEPSEPASIEAAKVVLSTTAFKFNGKVRKPVVETVDGKVLTEGTDYTVEWSDKSPKNVGSYTVTITGIGNYTGVTKATYKINPKGTSLKKAKRAKKAITVKWKKQSAKMAKSRITGYQIQLATDKKFAKNKKTVTVKGYKKTAKKVKKLKGGKKYYVRVRTYKIVKGKKYYSTWSKAKSATTGK